ncbi:MAG: transglutaminase domain-containing protein [Armatimonadota bacterium]
MLDSINKFGSIVRKRPGGYVAGKILNAICARIFDISTIILVFSRRITGCVDIDDIVYKETDENNKNHTINNLCKYVFDNIAYARSVYWLLPIDTLLIGYGDCKCHALLLHELFLRSGIESNIIVGATGYRNGFGRIHAWVEYMADGAFFVCDPTLHPEPIARQDYVRLLGSVVDITQEYIMKRPDMSVRVKTQKSTAHEDMRR